MIALLEAHRVGFYAGDVPFTVEGLSGWQK